MLGNTPVCDRVIQERQLVSNAFKAIRAYRHSPTDLLDEAHRNVQVELYKLLREIPKPEFKLPFPNEEFKALLEDIVKQDKPLAKAMELVHEWMTNKIQQSLQTATGPDEILEAHFLFCDEQVRFRYSLRSS